jgi:NTE family protein
MKRDGNHPSTAHPPALVLSGGGITGFLYEIGALSALEEILAPLPLHVAFSPLVGTSAGAVVAALLANGASPAAIYRDLFDDRDSPFNFRPDQVYGAAAANLAQLVAQFARPLIGACMRPFRQRTWPTLTGLVADFQAHHPPGFYSTEPLERTLCERFSALGYAHHFDELPGRLYVTGSDIDTGERLVFGAGTFRSLHICRAVAASCAIPIFFQPIRIGERDVVDGAVAEATPLDVAVDGGTRTIVHLNPLVPIRNDRLGLCLPVEDGHCARLAEKGVGWIGEQTFRMLLAARMDDSIAALRSRAPGLTVHVIQPGRDELPMFIHSVMSFAARRELLEYGHQCGLRAMRTDLGHALLAVREAAPAAGERRATDQVPSRPT